MLNINITKSSKHKFFFTLYSFIFVKLYFLNGQKLLNMTFNLLHNLKITCNLLTHKTVRLAWDNIKMDSQHAVKKVLDVVKK